MDNDLKQLKGLVDAVMPLPEADWLEFAVLWKPFSARRKETLTAMGEPEKYLYFVLEGVQRVFLLDESGREATLIFTYAPSFGGVLDAMLARQPSRYCYETLSASRFIRAPYSEIKLLADRKKAMADFMHVSLTAALSGLLIRMAELQCFSSEEKFRSLLSRSPHILQHVPNKYLANYLGIDPTNFSKLINRMLI
ncbi:MAG TPA: cyclic nucleotide-binding domain-containing protein [Pedobacter sp.]|nr:cyclic nucleotide-binding domain-containing protein [Pedobacter sp.]